MSLSLDNKFIKDKELKDLINSIETSTDSRSLIIISSCLLNMLTNNEKLKNIAIDSSLIEIILKYLKNNCDFETIGDSYILQSNRNFYFILHALNDSIGHDILCDPYNCRLLVDCINVNNIGYLIELVTSLCEDDNVKISMVKLGLIEKIISILRNFHDKTVKRMMLDVIIIILTYDTSMELLFQNGDGFLYKECIKWLQSDDQYKIVSAILALGNFARNDKNCILMVSSNIQIYLISILSENCSLDGNLRIQHAVLSTLRNLAIPMPNKKILAKTNLLDLLLKMKIMVSYPIVFKLLATIRMLTDSQEENAKIISNDEEFMKNLIKWCSACDHIGVKAEANRLLSLIVKNNPNIAKNISKLNGIRPLLGMISSGHSIMSNEGFIALIIIISSMDILTEDCLIEANLGEHIHLFLNQCQDNLPQNEILLNAFTVLDMLVRSIKIKNHLIQKGIFEDLEGISLEGREHLKEKLYQLKNSLT